MDTNDLIMKNIDMLEKMQRQEVQMLKTDFEGKMKDLTLKFEKLDETLSNLKDMLDNLRIEDEKPLPTTEELIETFKKRKEEEDKLKSSGGQIAPQQTILNNGMPSIEQIKNNMN